jgi:hypothetical protein
MTALPVPQKTVSCSCAIRYPRQARACLVPAAQTPRKAPQVRLPPPPPIFCSRPHSGFPSVPAVQFERDRRVAQVTVAAPYERLLSCGIPHPRQVPACLGQQPSEEAKFSTRSISRVDRAGTPRPQSDSSDFDWQRVSIESAHQAIFCRRS